jgi:hypothetical protein
MVAPVATGATSVDLVLDHHVDEAHPVLEPEDLVGEPSGCRSSSSANTARTHPTDPNSRAGRQHPGQSVIRALEDFLDKSRALDYARPWLAIRSRIGVAVAEKPSLTPTREAARRPGCHKGHVARGRTPTRDFPARHSFSARLVPGIELTTPSFNVPSHEHRTMQIGVRHEHTW